MYVTPPDTDVYAIPKVLAPMPQKVNLYLFFFWVKQMTYTHSILVSF